MFSIIDFKLRGFFSYIFRFLLVLYAIFLLITQHNFFPYQVYVAISILHILSFLTFKIKFKNGFFRFVCDYLFIGFVLYGKDIQSFNNYFLAILPLINAQNHSGKNMGYYTYPVICALVILLNNYTPLVSLILPLIIILIIELFVRLRNNIRKVNELTSEIVEDFYTKYVTQNDIFTIYKNLIENFTRYGITRFHQIECIIALDLKPKGWDVVNSSKPVLEFRMDLASDELAKLKQVRSLINLNATINKVESKDNLLIQIKGIDKQYYFLLTFLRKTQTLPSQINLALSQGLVFKPSLRSLAKLFEVQDQILLARNTNLEALKSSQQYVSKANEVMHFIKNSLSPIKSAIAIGEMYFNSIRDNDGNDIYLKESFIKQKKFAQDEMKNIIDRSNFILEKTKNPFEATQIKDYSFIYIIDVIRKKWEIAGLPPDINFTRLNTTDLELVVENCPIDYNTFYLIISNIISNINHSRKHPSLSFIIYNEKIVILFCNQIDSKDLISIKKIVANYNDNQRREIDQRKSHGFSHLKRYIESLDAESFLELVENKYFVFNLTLKVRKDESSDLRKSIPPS